MRVGILGAGKVGTALGRGLAKAGHQVLYAVREPGERKHGGLTADGSKVLAVPAVTKTAELVILATPWSAAEAALASAGDFEGKVLVDATNPIGPGMVLTHGHQDSGAEQVQRWASTARVVKAFNTTGVENISDPHYPDGSAAMFVCGDDEPGCTQVLRLCRDLGFDALRIGGLERARVLEPVMMLWVCASQALGTREFAFRLMRRD